MDSRDLEVLSTLVRVSGQRELAYSKRAPGLIELSAEAASILAAYAGGMTSIDSICRRTELRPALVAAVIAEVAETFSTASRGDGREDEYEWPSSVTDLRLFLTLRCNMACAHCYVGDGTSSTTRDMAVGTVRAAIDFAARVWEGRDDRLRLRLFGGEPALAWNELVCAVEYARDVLGPDRIQVILNTNGTLLSAEMARFMAASGAHVVLSMDASPAKPAGRSGHPFDPRALTGLQSLLTAECSVALSCVVDEAWDPESFVRFAADVGVKHLGLNEERFVSSAGGRADALVEKIWQAWTLGQELGVDVGGEWRWLLKRIESDSPSSADDYCGGVGRELSVLPDGSLLSCGAGVPLGSIFELDTEVRPTGIDRLRAWREDSKASCAECEIYRLCRGGCVADSMMRPNRPGCDFKRAIVERFLTESAGS